MQKRKKDKMSARKQTEKLRRQRREYIYQKKRKKKRQKRRQERERAEKRRQERERAEKRYQEKEHLKDTQQEVRIEETEENGAGEVEAKEVPNESQGGEAAEEKYHAKKQRKERRNPQQGHRRKRYWGRRYRKSRRYRRYRRWIRDKVVKIAILCLFLAALYVYCRPKVVEELVAEAGTDMPEISEFLMREYKDAHFTQEWEKQLDMHTVRDYEIGIMISDTEYTSVLHVVDTIAPSVVTKEVQIFKDHVLEPIDFIEKIEDATQTTAKFIEKPDFTVPGEQKVKLAVVDEGGNTTQVLASMEILEDLQPPVIAGVEELTVAIGDGISYKKNVTVSDNYDENVKLEIDNSQVDLNTQGDYPVTYIAKDAAGNVAEEETIVHVKPASVETATEEMVNKKADEILHQITTADMSQYEVAKAIFNWVHGNVGWSDGTPKTNWVQGAYRGLFERRGDCYVYASTSKCLLTQAGIANMDIGFSTERRTHYWNLIDLGEGWYHFDTTRRTDGKSFFYYNDADIREYSGTHNGSHAYNPADYPTIQ